MSKYFVDTGEGTEYHDTEESARQSAADWIAEYCTQPEWDEAVDRVCWGEVRQHSIGIPRGDYWTYNLEDVE